MKMECLQAVQIKGCGLTVLEPGIFFPISYLLGLHSRESRRSGGGGVYKDANIS